jgi:hypothetical protein
VTKQNILPLSRALLVCVQVGAGLDTRRIHTCLFPCKKATWPLLARVYLSVSLVLLSPLRSVLRYLSARLALCGPRLLCSRTALAHSRVSHSCVAAPGRLRLEEDGDYAGDTPVEDDGGGHDDVDAAE